MFTPAPRHVPTGELHAPQDHNRARLRRALREQQRLKLLRRKRARDRLVPGTSIVAPYDGEEEREQRDEYDEREDLTMTRGKGSASRPRLVRHMMAVVQPADIHFGPAAPAPLDDVNAYVSLQVVEDDDLSELRVLVDTKGVTNLDTQEFERAGTRKGCLRLIAGSDCDQPDYHGLILYALAFRFGALAHTRDVHEMLPMVNEYLGNAYGNTPAPLVTLDSTHNMLQRTLLAVQQGVWPLVDDTVGGLLEDLATLLCNAETRTHFDEWASFLGLEVQKYRARLNGAAVLEALQFGCPAMWGPNHFVQVAAASQDAMAKATPVVWRLIPQ